MRKRWNRSMLICFLILSLCAGSVRAEASSASAEPVQMQAETEDLRETETEETTEDCTENEETTAVSEAAVTSAAETEETAQESSAVEAIADETTAAETVPETTAAASETTEEEIRESEAPVDPDWDTILDGTLKWMRGEEKQVFNESFLKGVSSTGTDWYVFALGRLGIKDNYSGFLSAADQNVRDRYQKKPATGLSSGAATEWHRLTMAVLAAGGDPTSVGGKNLIEDGVYNCKVGEPWKQGINGAIWALMALDSYGYEVPEGASYDRSDLIDYILGKELSGGGWNLSGTKFDLDITAMAVQSLAPYYAADSKVKKAVDRAVTILRSSVQDDGTVYGYGSINCESTAQVIVAFAALGIDPHSVKGPSGKASLMDGLKAHYNTKDGGFYHLISSGTSNAMATSQALYAYAADRLYHQEKRGLYDFRETAQTDRYVVLGSDGNTYTAGSGDSVTLAVSPDVTSLTITDLPIGSYDAAVIRVGSKEYKTDFRRADGTTPVAGTISCKGLDSKPEGITLEVRVTRRDGTTETKTLTLVCDPEALITSVIARIDALPAESSLTLNDADTVKELQAVAEQMSAEDRAKVTNLSVLEKAAARIEALEAEEEEKLNRRREALKQKIQKISTPVTISKEQTILGYLSELEELGDWKEKSSLKKTLNGYLKDIRTRKALVDKLDQDIWDKIDPLRVTQKSAKTVNGLMTRYAALRSDEKTLLKNGESLLAAAAIIDSLNDNVIPAAVFKNIASTKEKFTFTGTTPDGDTYTVTYDGKTIQTYEDVKVKITQAKPDGKVKNSQGIVRINQSGSMNGRAVITLTTSVKDGTYALRWLNPQKKMMQDAGKITVKDGKMTWTATMGGRYDLVKETKQTTSSGTTNKLQMGTVKKKTTTKKVSNLGSVTKEGVFTKEELESIKGQDKILETVVGFEGNLKLTISINGNDVEKTDEYAFRTGTDCKNREDIQKLAANPMIFCLEETESMPGTILVTVQRAPWEEKLMLFRYNAETREAEYIKMVTAEPNAVKFTISEGGDYFVAARVLMGSLNDLEAEELAEIPAEETTAAAAEETTAQPLTAEETETAEAEDTGTEAMSPGMTFALGLGTGILLMLAFLALKKKETPPAAAGGTGEGETPEGEKPSGE